MTNSNQIILCKENGRSCSQRCLGDDRLSRPASREVPTQTTSPQTNQPKISGSCTAILARTEEIMKHSLHVSQVA